MEVAKYLDMLHGVKMTNHFHINEHLSMAHTIDLAQIAVESTYNEQTSSTQISLND